MLAADSDFMCRHLLDHCRAHRGNGVIPLSKHFNMGKQAKLEEKTTGIENGGVAS